MPYNQSTQATKKHHLNKYPYDLFMTVPITQANNHALCVSWACFYPYILERTPGLQSQAWYRYGLSRPLVPPNQYGSETITLFPDFYHSFTT
jgi:hypothetical protein